MEEYVSAPNLSTWGVEEIEANVCEDTFENRQKLSFAKVPFKILEPGLIEVLFQDYGELNKHHATQFEAKKIILSNPRDPWSDYLPFDELPLDYMDTAPAWMQRHLNKYQDAKTSDTPEHRLPVIPTRCRRRRADGSRCWQWSWPAVQAEGFCRKHCSAAAFNSTDQLARLSDAAKLRLSQLSEPALLAMEDLVLNSTVPHVRLKAATEVLDRIGIRGGSELNVSGNVTHEVLDPAQEVRNRLNALAARISPKELEEAVQREEELEVEIEIVEAEVIEK